MTLREELDALDKAATQGEWLADPYGYVLSVEGQEENIAHLYDGEYIENPNSVADAALVATLVNVYRSGDLVPLAEVEEARLAALEEAAKIAEQHANTWDDCGASIAQAIRDLANKGKV